MGRNFGLGKRHPGLSLFTSDEKEVPVFFAATPDASMDASILRGAFEMMDENKITQSSIDADGKEYFPLS